MPVLLAALLAGGLVYFFTRRSRGEPLLPGGGGGGGGIIDRIIRLTGPVSVTAMNISPAEANALVQAAASSSDVRQPLVWAELVELGGLPQQGSLLRDRALELIGFGNPPADLSEGLQQLDLDQELFVVLGLAENSPTSLNRAAAIARDAREPELAAFIDSLNPAPAVIPAFTDAEFTAVAQAASQNPDFITKLAVADLIERYVGGSAPLILRRQALSGATITQSRANDPAWTDMLRNLPLSVQIGLMSAIAANNSTMITRAADLSGFFNPAYRTLIMSLFPAF